MEENKLGKNIKKVLISIAVLLVCILGMINVYKIFDLLNITLLLDKSEITQKQALIETYIDRLYYKEADPKTLETGSYRGIVNSLDDPYSTYFTAEEYDRFNISTTSEYAGIGASLTKDPDTKEVTISNVYDDTPAMEAGLKEGDTIVSADGQLAISMDLEAFTQILRGEKGTTVNVVYRRGDSEYSVDITRRIVVLPSVFYNMLDDNIGYIQISNFASHTEEEFKKAVTELTAQGMDRVVYDIRSNPGGLVDSVVNILDYILPEGVVVYLEDKQKNRTDYTSDEEHQLDLPCVVLTDEGTASSAEIFAGALRDSYDATLIGTTTTGKGVVQNVMKLPDGSAIKLTIAEYFTPSGTAINEKGLAPDIELEYKYLLSSDEDAPYEFTRDNQVVRAVEFLGGRAENMHPQ